MLTSVSVLVDKNNVVTVVVVVVTMVVDVNAVEGSKSKGVHEQKA